MKRLATRGSSYSKSRFVKTVDIDLEIKHTLQEKFDIDLSTTITKSVLHIDEKGYELYPHCDHPAKKLSIIVYLDDFAEGTILYKHNRSMTDNSGKRFDPKDFKIINEIKAKKNRALIFPRSDHSWHGVQYTTQQRKIFMHVYQDKDWVPK